MEGSAEPLRFVQPIVGTWWMVKQLDPFRCHHYQSDPDGRPPWHVRLTLANGRVNAARVAAWTPAEALQAAQSILLAWADDQSEEFKRALRGADIVPG